MTKKELRKLYREKRSSISEPDKLKLNDLLLIQFQRLPLNNIHVLLSYWPMEIVAEPNMHLFLRYITHMMPSVQLAYPVTDFLAGTMEAYLVNEDTNFENNEYGIIEPKNGELISPAIIDVAFIPLLICDEQGYRVGFGKGFYDKYLALCKSDIIKIGFSYFEPVHEIDDAQPFDVPLNFCITPYNIHKF